jgi:hypothetical protein
MLPGQAKRRSVSVVGNSRLARPNQPAIRVFPEEKTTDEFGSDFINAIVEKISLRGSPTVI